MSISHEQRPERLIDENGRRTDGRLYNELRPVKLKVGVLGTADGSAYIEQGKTRIIVAVYGPRELHPRHLALSDKAYLRCTYRMATFSVPDRKNPAPTRREREISMVVANAIEPVIFIRDFPRAVIDVYIQVLQADGGTRAAAITAAAVALADAGIPMRNLVTAVAVGKADGQIVLDLNDKEDKYGEGDVPVAMIPGTDQITLLQQDGKFTPEEFKKAMELVKKGIAELYEVQKEAIRNAYKVVVEETAESAELGESEKLEEYKPTGDSQRITSESKSKDESAASPVSESTPAIESLSEIEKTEEETELSRAIHEAVAPISRTVEHTSINPEESGDKKSLDLESTTEPAPSVESTIEANLKAEPESNNTEERPSENTESSNSEEAS